MKNSRLNKSSKEPPVKRQIGKLKIFHQKRNLLKAKLSAFSSDEPSKFNNSIEYNQSPQMQSLAPSDNENYAGVLSKGSSKKQWWIHVWQGLVMDKASKHQKAMRQAIGCICIS